MSNEDGRVKLTLNVTNDRVVAWAKVVGAVNLKQPGGSALEGPWLEKEYKGANSIIFKIPTAVSNTMPIVVGASIYAESLEDKPKNDQPIINRIACVITYDGRLGHQSHPVFGVHKIEGMITEPKQPDNLVDVGNDKLFDSVRDTDGFSDMPVYKSQNVFYWTAVFIKKNFPNLKDVDISRIAPKPMKLHPRDTIFENNEKISLPEGYVFLCKISNIWLAGERINGTKNLSFLDMLVNTEEPLDDNVLDLMEDQAKKLEALAMTYRIVALSKKNREVSQD